MSESPARPYIGGQAVIEGVMMRSPGSFAIVCRRKGGELVVHEEPMAATRTGWKTWPFLRGVGTLVDALRLGHRSMQWATRHFELDLDEEQPPAPKPKTSVPGTNLFLSTALSIVALGTSTGESAPAPPAPPGQAKSGGGSMLFAVLFMVILMVAAPQAGAEGLNKWLGLGLDVTSPGFQVITGVMKLTVVSVFYLLLRRNELIYRVFQYHGAEHKTITTYEAQEDLIVENARTKTTAHARCGTTFIVMVALVSIVVFSVAGAFLPKVDAPRWVQSILFFFLKLPFLPLVTGITFEIQRVFARYCTTGPLRVLLWPGFLVQKITTAEPDDAQLEVALASLRATLWREQAAHAPKRDDRVFESYPALVSDPGYA
jgi:uncharacterized protein YqhQ